MEIYREGVFILLFLVKLSFTEVKLKFPTKFELGKPFKLDCETSYVVQATKSRQWRGGADNKLLCYDGTTVNPNKYKEKIINQTNYELIVENTCESDLRCPYACRVGFDIDQQFLEVDETNFVHLPEFSNVDYQMQNGKYRLTFILNKVFPKPVCELKINGAKRVIPVLAENKSHVLFNVTYSLESSDAISPCGEKLEIECQVGKTKHLIPSENINLCNPSQTTHDSKTTIIIPVVCVCVACIIVGLGVALVLWKRRNGNNKHNNRNNELEEEEASFMKDGGKKMSQAIIDEYVNEVMPFSGTADDWRI
ncbi:uncharacterized protein LOC134701277 isoform X2 [Mytilus trossulus]|uniref:uncharacterized protein LOC134701277 isoform X2 n=1 Tax=Mytilus trossulus TaxID=6551 RepID=UPI0030042267